MTSWHDGDVIVDSTEEFVETMFGMSSSLDVSSRSSVHLFSFHWD